MQRVVLAMCQALTVGGVGRGIVELLLAERRAGLCFHRGQADRQTEVGVVVAVVVVVEGLMRMQCKGCELSRRHRGAPSLMKRDLACHASPCTCDKRFWLAPANLGECNVHPGWEVKDSCFASRAPRDWLGR